MGAFIFFILVAVVFLVIGIIIIITGYATERKPLKLAGIVVAVLALQGIGILFFEWILANYY